MRPKFVLMPCIGSHDGIGITDICSIFCSYQDVNPKLRGKMNVHPHP